MHPDMRSKFPWGSKPLSGDGLVEDKDVQAHAEQVFKALFLTVSNMDDISALSDYFYNEGMEHIIRQVTTQDFQQLEDATMYVFKEELGDLYTSQFKKGMQSLFTFVVENMQRGMRGEERLTEDERNELSAAWRAFEVNLVDNGVDVFLNLIDEHPDLEYIFPWGSRGLSEAALRDDPEIKKHASLVFNAVAPAFKKLSNLDTLSDYYVNIGNNHLDRNIPPITFSYLADAFHKTFHKVLGADYTDGFEQSFDLVFDFITNKMLEGMSGIKTLSDKQKELIKSAWGKFSENLGGNGVLVFLKFVHDYPELLHSFPWGKHDDVDYEAFFTTYRDLGFRGLSRNQLAVYEEMQPHAQQVFGGIAVAVDAIDNIDTLDHYYNALGVRHIPRGVTPEQFLWIGDAIMYGFRHILGEDYTSEFETGFFVLYNFITHHMSEGLGGGVSLSSNERKALQDGFAAVKGHLGEVGADAFASLIEADDSFRQRFPWANNDLKNDEIRSYGPAIEHGEKVLHAVDIAVANVGRLNSFVSYFVDEGVRHVPRLVTEDDFRALSTALLPAFERKLGNLYTDDFKNGLTSIFNFITDNMAKGLSLSSVKDITLDSDEVKSLHDAWAKVSGDIPSFGAKVFVRVVHDHPEIRSYFPWGRNDRTEAELVDDPSVKVHADQVFGTMGKVIDSSDNLNDFRSFLVFKGMQHIPRGVKPEHFDWLRDALVDELKEEIGDLLTPAAASGLGKVYDFIELCMLKGLTGSHFVKFAEKVALERGWKVFDEQLGENGAKVFIRLIKAQPTLRPYFPWGRNDKTYDELLKDPEVINHAKQVFGGIGAAIHHADNLDATSKYYHDLGVNHLSRGVTKEHFPLLKDALKSVLKEVIGDLYTNDFVTGFETVYGFVTNEMIQGLGDSTDLTTHQKDVIRDAYAVFKANEEKNAADTFLYLIQQHPDLKSVFPWKDVPNDQLRDNPGFKEHVRVVFKGLSVAIDRMDNLKSTTKYYINLGQAHVTRGATDAAFDAVGEAILHTYKNILGVKYDDDFVSSFTHVIEFVVGNMKVGMAGQGDIEVEELTTPEKEAVKAGFKHLSDLGDFGRKVFILFIKNNPESRNLFPWGRNEMSEAELLTSQDVYDHADTVFKAVEVAVERMDALGSLAGYYTALGVRHIPRHLEHKHFSWMEDAINEVMAEDLGDDYTTDFKTGFGKILHFLVGRMELGMTSGKSITAAQKAEVTKAWAAFASDLETNGATVFAKLVTKFPDMKDVFPWGHNADTESGLIADPGVREHAKTVFSRLGDLLSDVANLKDQRTALVALGRRHIPRNVTIDQLMRLGVVLDEYFQELLGEEASLDFRLGWDLIYANIIDNMRTGLNLHR